MVRRFGPVGGMEHYVWETARELRALDHQVEVPSEVCVVQQHHGIVDHEQGTVASRPRWLALMRFTLRCHAVSCASIAQES